MKYKDLKTASAKELDLKLRQTKAELLALRTKKTAGQLEKPHQLKALRRDVARILTALNVAAKSATTEKKSSKKATK